jgi:hypothetical protein
MPVLFKHARKRCILCSALHCLYGSRTDALHSGLPLRSTFLSSLRQLLDMLSSSFQLQPGGMPFEWRLPRRPSRPSTHASSSAISPSCRNLSTLTPQQVPETGQRAAMSTIPYPPPPSSRSSHHFTRTMFLFLPLKKENEKRKLMMISSGKHPMPSSPISSTSPRPAPPAFAFGHAARAPRRPPHLRHE